MRHARHSSSPSLLAGAAPGGDPVRPSPSPSTRVPDFERAEWVNLNGDWAFRFDPDGAGERERWFETALRLPADDPRALPVGLEAVGRRRRGGGRLVRAHDPRAGGLDGEAGLPRGRRLRLEDRAAGSTASRSGPPGRLHALRAGAHGGRAARDRPAARPPRRRRGAPVQARGQAGLRQRARDVADGLPRGAAGGPRGFDRDPPEPGRQAGRGAGDALGPRAGRGERARQGADGRLRPPSPRPARRSRPGPARRA
jgi:hypothetical protein